MIELIPESYVQPLDLEKTFGRRAPLQVDLGCGDGTFLRALAEATPERNFLGIDRMAGRVQSAIRKTAKLTNVRVLKIEVDYAVRYLLPPHSVETFYLLFPDPWPKRRHHRRRTVTIDFLHGLATALIENGVVRILTDQLDYFQQISSAADHSLALARTNLNGQSNLPLSTFEKRFVAARAEIHRLALRKVSPVT